MVKLHIFGPTALKLEYEGFKLLAVKLYHILLILQFPMVKSSLDVAVP
jgi:hypothetical protein